MHTITLTVTDDLGKTDTDQEVIEVRLADVCDVSQLDMGRYGKGLYLLEVTVEGESLVRKIVKM